MWATAAPPGAAHAYGTCVEACTDPGSPHQGAAYRHVYRLVYRHACRHAAGMHHAPLESPRPAGSNRHRCTYAAALNAPETLDQTPENVFFWLRNERGTTAIPIRAPVHPCARADALAWVILFSCAIISPRSVNREQKTQICLKKKIKEG